MHAPTYRKDMMTTMMRTYKEIEVGKKIGKYECK